MSALAEQVGKFLAAHQYVLATAESCTGGWVAQEITAIAGSSAWFDSGFVTYSNKAKTRMLEVSEETLSKWGAVSEAVVVEMARGAIKQSAANVAIAISGVAGPGGGSIEKPVGTVWIAWSIAGHESARCYSFSGDRESVRAQAMQVALEGLLP
mgnify:CR=1 FL=1